MKNLFIRFVNWLFSGFDDFIENTAYYGEFKKPKNEPTPDDH